MKTKYINKIFNFWIGLFLFLSIILIETKLHIYGPGVENENKLIFGFFDFIGFSKASFYEINSFFFCLLIAALVFIFSRMEKKRNTTFNIFYTFVCVSFSIIVYTFFSNLTDLEVGNPTVNYSVRFFVALDDLIESKHLIYIYFNEVNYQLVFYSILIFIFSFVVLIINSVFPSHFKGLEEIDHLVEKN